MPTNIPTGGVYDQNAILTALCNAYDVAHQIQANPGVSPQPNFDSTSSGRYVITKGSAAVVTLGAPVAGRDDGLSLSFLSSTAFAHQIVSTGNLQDGAGHSNQLQFPAQAGACVDLIAYNGKWNVVSSNGIFTNS